MARTLGDGEKVPVLPEVAPDEAGIVHLGLGNFHRAHQAVYTAAALASEPGPWGIVGVANRSRGVVDALRQQDGRYSVVTLAEHGAAASVFRIHPSLLVTKDQPTRVRDRLAASSTRIVTLTITERGYTASTATGGLDLDHEAVRSDLRGEGQPTAIGLLARALLDRFRSHGARVSIVSCDNLAANGRTTERLVREFLAALEPPDSEDALSWIGEHARFPSTMVDRIVPATEPSHVELAGHLLGVSDAVPVPAEPFSMWVLEDDFAAGRPRWEAGGAILAPDVHDYELVKLRLLNASNSMLAYLGLLAGERLIADAVRVPPIRRAVEQLIIEMSSTLTMPSGIDHDDYVESLFERFGNRALGHRTSQVATDGSRKVPVRITDAALQHLRDDAAPPAIALLTAAYLRCFTAPDSYDTSATGRPADPEASSLAELGRAHPQPRDLVRAAFDHAGIFPPDLNDAADFIALVSHCYELLARGGVAAVTSIVSP